MTTIGILGVLHDPELRQRYGLTMELIEELIVEFNPDVICGEVLPSSWDKFIEDPNNRGYWGEPASEYWELIFPLCEQRSIVFEPIDWVELDVWTDFDPFNQYAEPQKEQLENELDRWFEKQLAAGDTNSIPFNSIAFDQVTKLKYEWLEQLNPQAHVFRWECRHLIMIQRIKNAIKRHPGKRILCIAGADHNYMLCEGLGEDKEIQLVYPLGSFC
ncbi:hypothetical protein [Paenibacillus kobensis]|uniref:hypothetical protein n=1 Tax=Paenibacillus kobensis TaxID=59841 RepID=UPI000FD76A4D|nr:hypothetical protein [Paenibacillus kobensis]